MAGSIRFVLSHIPVIMFIAAFIVAAASRRPAHFATRLLCWMLLLSVGVEETWAGLFHVFFAKVAASSIGWQVSPFQFEIGVADIAIGVTAIASFWRSLPFKAATVFYITLFYAGVAIGHVREAVTAGNTSANNFGLLLVITIVKVFLLPALYLIVRRNSPADGDHR
jgi:hypothetical protein